LQNCRSESKNKASSSFLKKRTKKLLRLQPAAMQRARRIAYLAAKNIVSVGQRFCLVPYLFRNVFAVSPGWRPFRRLDREA
jgi:hypothetical protein